MRRLSFRLSTLLLGALVAVALRGPSARADEEDGRTRSFADKNFKLTIPAEWTWDELNDRDKEIGFSLIARRVVDPGVVEASARVRVVDARGATLDTLLTGIKDQKTKDLKEVTANTGGVTWAGLDAQRLAISGKYENGGGVAFEIYGAIVGGIFHELELRCTNGAEDRIRDELNALAEGYALLKGGGALPPGHPPTEGGGEGGDQGGEAGGLSRTFPKLGLTWTLPKAVTLPPAKEGEEGKTVTWGWIRANDAKPDLDKGARGLLARAGMGLGDEVPVIVELVLHPEQPGASAEAIVNNAGNFEELDKNFSDQPPARIDTDAEVGNARGASRTLNGKDKADPPRPLYIKMWFVNVQGAVFQVVLIGHDDAESKYKPQVQEALQGLAWGDLKTGTRGPWMTPFASFTAERKDSYDLGKDVPVKLGAVQARKPASFARLKFDMASDRYKGWVFGAEARKDAAYAFVGVQRMSWKDMQAQAPPVEVESLVDSHEAEWKNQITDPVTLTQRNGKANKKPDSFAGGKGVSYEFRGSAERQPLVEKGWVVRSGPWAWWVHVQFVGKDAEVLLGKDTNSLVKSLKLLE